MALSGLIVTDATGGMVAFGSPTVVVDGGADERLFDVTDDAYGAVGDGVTDDTAAIRLAVAAVIAAAPARLHFPRGTYIVNDATSGSSGGVIRITAAADGVKITGDHAVLRIGSTGVAEAVVRIFADRCDVSGLIVDVNADVATDSAGKKASSNTGFEINAGNDNHIHHCQAVGGYTGDTIVNNGAECFSIVNGERNRISFCYAEDATWQAFRVAGNDSQLLYCTAYNHRGNGVRVLNDLARVTIKGFRSYSTRNHGRHGIIADPGSASGSTARTEYLLIDDCACYCNPDATGDGGAAHTLKLASVDQAIIRNSYFGAGSAAEAGGTANYAVRIEDSVAEAYFDGVRIDPTMYAGDADNADSSVYQGLVTSISSGTGGKCRIVLSGTSAADAWEFQTGKSLWIMGSTEASYNQEHFVETIVDDENHTIETDVDYVSGTIGSSCFARSSIDVLRLRNCHFGNASIVDGEGQDLPLIEGASPRVLEIEACTFEQKWNSSSVFNAIDWGVSSDVGFDLIRIVDNDFTFNTTTNPGRMINPTGNSTTTLVTSGKIISHDNRLKNLGSGAAVLCNSANANANRQILFSTDGEAKNRFRWTTSVNASDVATIFKKGDVIQMTGAAVEFVCATEGTSGSTASTLSLRASGYRAVAIADGTAVASQAGETTATPASINGSLQIGGGRAMFAGESFRVRASGIYSTTGTPTLDFGLSFGKKGVGGSGAETGATTLASIGSFTTPSGAANLRWRFDLTGVVRTTGSTGTIQVRGRIAYETATNVWVESIVSPADVTVNTSNTSHNRKADVFCNWGTGHASNSFTCQEFYVSP